MPNASSPISAGMRSASPARPFCSPAAPAFSAGTLSTFSATSSPAPVREDLHFIIHAAGVASPVYYMKYPLQTIESAVHGTKNLLELARKNQGLEGFLFFSSSEIYGDPDPKSIPTPETYH